MSCKFRHIKISHARFFTAGALFLLLALLPATAVLADPGNGDQTGGDPGAAAAAQIQDLQAQADAIQAQVNGLDHDLEVMVEQHNASLESVDQLTMQLADSRSRLDAAQARYNQEDALISNRLSAMYKAGTVNVVSMLLNSSSINDFLNQTHYMEKINEQDQKLENQFKASADEIQTLTDNIDHERAQQMQMEQQLQSQVDMINARIYERQQMLNGVNGQVQQIMAQEEARKQAEQAQLAAQYAATLNSLQISDQLQARVVSTAMQYLGVPYVWGGESPKGFDCSGLTKYVFAQFGVNLPHNAAMQFQLGTPVPRDQLQPGDLVFWGPGHPHHVGLYIGQGKFIEAPDFGEVVRISQMSFDSDYAGARRYPLRMP